MYNVPVMIGYINGPWLGSKIVKSFLNYAYTMCDLLIYNAFQVLILSNRKDKSIYPCYPL